MIRTTQESRIGIGEMKGIDREHGCGKLHGTSRIGKERNGRNQVENPRMGMWEGVLSWQDRDL